MFQQTIIKVHRIFTGSDITVVTDRPLALSSPNNSYFCNQTHHYKMGKDVVMVIKTIQIQGMRILKSKFSFGKLTQTQTDDIHSLHA